MDILIRSFLWVFHASITASIAALLIILISKLFDKHISIRLQHALWIIVVIKLIIPIEFQSNLSLFNLLHERQNNSSNIENRNTVKNITYAAADFLREGKAQQKHTAKNQISQGAQSKKENAREYIITNAWKIASCIWIGGFFIAVAFLLVVKYKFKGKNSNLEEVKDLEIVKLFNKCKNEAKINKYIPVYTCDNFESPCILGIVKPKIYIPRYIISENNFKQLYHILLHELVHYKRRDLIYNFLAVFAVILHWFNPIIWFCMKRMKLQRECVCDAYVLEIIGEEQAEEYGMTLINFSKLMSINKRPQLVAFFETKNQIRGRIKMIKKFKKGSYKMSVVAVLCCVLASGAVLTTSVSAKGMKLDNAAAVTSSNGLSIKSENNKFLIDAPVKVYDNLKKAEEITGFKIKVPDYLPANYEVWRGFKVVKVSDKDNYLKVYLRDKQEGGLFSFQASKVNLEECLSHGAENVIKMYQSQTSDTTKDSKNGKIQISKEKINLSGINGTSITVKIIDPELPRFADVRKYFVWQNDGMYYGIEYNYGIQVDGEIPKDSVIPQSEVEKIISSLKYIKDIKNVNYSVQTEVSPKVEALSIYDKEDLKRAKEFLGFDFKFPLSINKDITIDSSGVAPSEDSDIKNGKINYQLNTRYNAKAEQVLFTQEKSSKSYDYTKKTVKPINIGDKEVFKQETYKKSKTNEQLKEYIYTWKEDGFYCKLSTAESNGNPDKIAKEFINSKLIN